MHDPAIGRAVQVLEWANGDGFRNYEHALIYAGQYGTTPTTVHGPAPIVGSGPGHYVIEAAPGGARWRNIGDAPEVVLQGALWSTDAFPLTLAQQAAVVQAAVHYLGTPYSWADYGALVWHHLHLPWPGLQDYVADTGHMICSQLVDQCYADTGIHLFTDGRWPGYVTPEALADLVLAKTVTQAASAYRDDAGAGWWT